VNIIDDFFQGYFGVYRIVDVKNIKRRVRKSVMLREKLGGERGNHKFGEKNQLRMKFEKSIIVEVFLAF
jgi:hypothetical protein